MIDLEAHSVAVIRRWQTPSGAFIAGPTFSQYGFTWFRDGAFTAEAMDVTGNLDVSARFHGWVAGVVAEGAAGIERAIAAAGEGRLPDAADYLHCRYTANGELGPGDWPTFQLDGPGIWLWSLAHHVRAGGRLTTAQASSAALVARYLAALRDTPASDAWEEWPDVVHTSTLGAMLAGLRAAAELGVDGQELSAAREAIEGRLLGPGCRWTKWPGNDAMDASLLWLIAPYGLADPATPSAAEALRRIEGELEAPDGGVHRYLGDTFYGGGSWILLTAALARARLRRGLPGDRARALRALSWIEAQADAAGDLPEQDPTHALHPERIEAWRTDWGDAARPLLWSHAAYLSLRHDLANGDGVT